MLGKIVWKKSGDEIKFVPTFPDLLIYYVENLNIDKQNCFRLNKTKFQHEYLKRLGQCLTAVKSVGDKIPFLIDDWDGDLLDQSYLNKLHRQWVQTGLQYPNLPTLLKKINGLDCEYRDINFLLHNLESSFSGVYTNYNSDPYQLDNIFGTKVLGFQQSNINLGFDNLGRSSWDKFCNFDNNISDSDTNDYKKLSGYIELNLDRPLSNSVPIEYVDWCNQHDIPVVGHTLSFGNIPNLDANLTELRKIFIRNINEQDDEFFLEFCS